MFLSIDVTNGVPIYEQVVRQVKSAIADEARRPGQLLPSIRTLSVDLAINPNTVARALQLASLWLQLSSPSNFLDNQDASSEDSRPGVWATNAFLTK